MTPRERRRIIGHIRNGNVARAAMVQERDQTGKLCTRILDVRDVEERKPDAKEIVIVDKETEAEILRALHTYKWTFIYSAVMLTLICVSAIFQALT